MYRRTSGYWACIGEFQVTGHVDETFRLLGMYRRTSGYWACIGDLQVTGHV